MYYAGKQLFINSRAQVLIASSPLAIGVDGLQTVCNRLIINSLPWTNARYQQLVGRLVRYGQKMKSVSTIIIRASIKYGDKKWEYDARRWNRIENKRTLADCAVDGILPRRGLVTPDQAHREAIRWLERLERGEISTLSRRDLVVELTPVELEKCLARYGDLAKHHQKINSEYSSTTHTRMQNNREEFFDYHRKLDEKRKRWKPDPRDIIISRIKTMSPLLRIGNFGCGTAKLMEEIGYSRVKSFDHVAINERVIECDIRDLSDHINDGGLEIGRFNR